MTACLAALGSNLGDRSATLDAAIDALASAPGVRLIRRSQWRRTRPVGGADLQGEFLNGAVLLETSRRPVDLLHLCQRIEADFGRERAQRWASRTLDIDVLLYGREVVDTAELQVPHPRMSFRRFVLEPAVEVAGTIRHPVLDLTLAELLHQLNAGSDSIAIVSPAERARRNLAALLVDRCGAAFIGPPWGDEPRWPPTLTTWLSIETQADAPTVHSPKLTILVDAAGSADADWTTVATRTGRGPTLRIPSCASQDAEREALAAVTAVWPHLCPTGCERLQ